MAPLAGALASPRAFMPALFLAALFLLMLGWAVVGSFTGVDTKWYLISGEKLIEWILDGAPESERIWIEKLFIVPHYVISTTVITGVSRYLELGKPGVVILNSVLFSLTLCMVCWIWSAVYGFLSDRRPMRRIGMAAAGIYIVFGLPDAPLWVYAILTDTIFLFWVATFVYLVARALLNGDGRMWLPAMLVAVTAPFVRPTGMILPLLCLFALLLYHLRNSERLLRYAVVAGIALPVAAVFIILPVLVMLEVNGRGGGEYVPGVIVGQFQQSVFFFKQGLVAADRLHMDVGDPMGYLDVVKVMVYRIAYYLIPIRVDAYPYSVMHNAVNLVYIGVTLPLAALGAGSLMGAAGVHKALLGLLLAVACGYALLHAATLVSYDWRYQLPGMVPLWVLAGCGCCSILGYRPGGSVSPAGEDNPTAL